MIQDWLVGLLLIVGIVGLVGLLIIGFLVARLEQAFLAWTRTIFDLERRYKEREP